MKDNNNGTKDESPSVNLHLQESGNMQKEWFTYALDAIQKLSDKLEVAVLSIQKEREDSLMRLIDFKNQLTTQSILNDKNNSKEWTRITTKLDETLKELKEGLSISESNTTTLLKEFNKDYSNKLKAVEITIQDTKDNQLVVGTRVKTYIAITGVIVTAVITIITGSALVVFKDVIKAWVVGS